LGRIGFLCLRVFEGNYCPGEYGFRQFCICTLLLGLLREREGDALCSWRGIGGLNDLRVAGRLTNSLLGFVVSAEGFACK
jgi:hypothetical protein